MPASAFAAYHRIVAGDLDPPDWPVHGAGDASDEGQARKELADELGSMAVSVGKHCADLVCGWRDAAAAAVARRKRREEGRELLRVCMRAWHEVSEGVRAFAAEFDQAFARGECTLARRLVFATRAPREATHRWPEEDWSVAFMLEWMRLVRAGTVRQARRRSPAWLAARARWQNELSDAMRAPPRQDAAADDRDARASDVARRRQLGKEKDAQQAQAKRQRREEAAAAVARVGAGSSGDDRGAPAQRSVPPGRAPNGEGDEVAVAAHGAAGSYGRDARLEGGAANDAAACDECTGFDEPERFSDGDDGPSGDLGPARSRRVRTDGVLRLRPAALAALRVALTRCDGHGDDLRLAHARLARGVG